MKIRPLHDRILVKREEEKEVKKGGIIIPDTATHDRILFGKYSGSEVKVDDQEYLIMKEEDVLAIIE